MKTEEGNKAERTDRLSLYLETERRKVIELAGLMFMGNPDKWYDPYTVCCINGHVSNRYLKSEALGKNVCLSCQEDVYLCPDISENQLTEILWHNSTTPQTK